MMSEQADRAGGDGLLPVSEEERHAIAHARYQVSQASIANPDCSFDYDLVKDLLRVIDRSLAAPPSGNAGEGKWNWGLVVQTLLRCMDHYPKGENSREQAERMADELAKKLCLPAAPPQPAPDALREALIQISDLDWGWAGGGSDIRRRGRCGLVAAQALGLSKDLPLGWPDPKTSETRKALAALAAPVPSGEEKK